MQRDQLRLAEWQDRSIREAARLLCVSRTWADWIRDDLGAEAEVVGNGVDLSVYRAEPTEADAAARERWGVGAGPVILSVGGFEERKNTLGIIEAFARLRARHQLHLLRLRIVGGGVDIGAFAVAENDQVHATQLTALPPVSNRLVA